MKRLLLIMLSVALTTATFANHNPFKKTKERKEAHNKMKSINFNDFQARANAVVPTLIKQSYWENSLNTWQASSALRNTYANDVVVTSLQMNYTQTDTIFRQTNTYNANKQLVQMYGEQYIGGIFVPNSRYTITYNNLKQFVLGENYDSFSQTWQPFSRVNIEFNTRGEQIKYIFEQYNGGVWQVQFGYSTFISYLNNTNKIVDLIDSSYNFNSMQMEPDYRESKTYNANEEVVEIMSYSNNGLGSLVLETKDSVFYTLGIPSKLIQYEYDSVSNTFNRAMKFDQLTWLNFDPTIDLFYNQPIGFWIYSWDNNAWIQEERTNTTFPDANGSRVELTEVYNNMNVWVNQARYSEYYDSRKNETESSNEVYNNQTSTWETIYGEKYMYQYDVNNNIVEEINEEFNSTISAYQKTNKYEYSDFITIALGINTIKNTLEATLYPNPSTNGSVSVNVNMIAASTLNIKITDLKGSIVYTDESNLGKGVNTIELKNLEQGMYIVELNTEYGVSRTKLVVRY